MLTLRASLAACAACAVTAFAAVSTTPTNHASPPATAVHPAPDGLRAILASFGTSDLANDLNADGRVDTTDLIVALSRMQGGNAGPIAPTAHRIDTIEPTIVGIGTKIRIRGSGLGTKANAAVAFGDSAIADDVEKHDSGEVIVSVPKGAPFGEGDVKVVVGAGDAVTLKEMAPAARLAALSRGAPATPKRVAVVNSFTTTPRNEAPFRLDTGRTSNNGLEARRITPDGSLAWNNINYTGQATVVWSPDGSEFMLNNDLYKRNNAERIQNWFNAGSVYTWSW